MSGTLTIRTNNVPRFTIEAYELSPAEREEFDYLDWRAIEAGEDSATFIWYRGRLYDIGEFQTTSGMPEFSPIAAWHGYLNDSFFSGIVVRYTDDYESVIVGTFYA